MRIAVVNTKGGVGKTTTAIYLAAAAASTGVSVEIVDLDKQGSAAAWLGAADEHPNTVVASRVNANLVGRSERAKVTIIDTSPANSHEIDKAAEVADYVVIPSMPGPLNDTRALATWNYLNAKGVAAAVLLVGADSRRKTTSDSKDLFEGIADVFETTIPNRTAIARSANHWPKHLFGYDNVLTEIMEAAA
jgi:chromosome partitioning protein